MTASLEQKLIEAVYKKEYETVRDCIRQGADVNFIAPEPISFSPLLQHSAAWQTAGKTPLYVAVEHDDKTMAEILLKEGHADPNILIADLLYPLVVTADYSSSDDLTALLLQYNANPNVRCTDNGNTPLIERAGGGGQYKIVKLMLEKGADVNATNNKGENALYVTQKRLEYYKLSNIFNAAANIPIIALLCVIPTTVIDAIETRKTISLLKKAMKKAP